MFFAVIQGRNPVIFFEEARKIKLVQKTARYCYLIDFQVTENQKFLCSLQTALQEIVVRRLLMQFFKDLPEVGIRYFHPLRFVPEIPFQFGIPVNFFCQFIHFLSKRIAAVGLFLLLFTHLQQQFRQQQYRPCVGPAAGWTVQQRDQTLKLVVKIGKTFVGLADFFVFQLCG